MHTRACVLGCAAVLAAAVISTAMLPGCGRTAAGGSEPEVKVRLQRLLALYHQYVRKHGKGPSNVHDLVQFGQKLTPAERASYLIGDDLESIFISPRDNQRFQIRWNLKLDATGDTRTVAWEATPQNGMRYAALSMLYVEQYDEETFQSYNH